MFLLRSGSFPNADGLISFPRGDGCGLRPWRVGGVTAQPRSPAPPSFSPTSPSHLPLRWRTEKGGKTPMRVGGWPAEARPRGIGLPVEAAQGQKSSAQGDWTRGLRRRHGRAALADGAPAGVASGARGSFPSPEDSSGARVRMLWLGVRASRAADRPIGRARGRGRASQHRQCGGKGEKG
jgi:hypothetical protein